MGQLNQLSVNNGPFELASGTTSWTYSASLVKGTNTITARATDTSGNIANTTISVYYLSIEDYFPYYYFSDGEKYYPASFYFDNDANMENNKESYGARIGAWYRPYIYINTVEDGTYFTIQCWLYHAYNPWGWPVFDHEHDWESVYVVFDKNDLIKPIEVRYSYHHWMRIVIWDNVEKIGSHSIVYVAEDSHAAYPNPESVLWYDTWTENARLGPSNFNEYLVGNCINETAQDGTVFCLLEKEILKGILQPEPKEEYWPRDFTGEGRDLVAPWYRPVWDQTRPTKATDYLVLGIRYPTDVYVADLHIYDPLGRHVGMNYTTSQFEVQIPDVEYSIENDGQFITISNPIDSDYKIQIIGNKSGIYHFATYRTLDDNIIYWKENLNTSITQSEVHSYTIPPRSPRYLKNNSITKLEDAKTSDKKIDKEIDKIIEHVQKSLVDKKKGSLWIDDWRIVVKHGKKVFHEEKKAVKRMQKEIKKEKTPAELKTVFEEVIDDLVKADEVLAKTIIEDAKIMLVIDPDKQDRVDKEIARAEKELAKAYEELAKERPDKAIKKFEKAWKYAQHAIKHAQEVPKGGA